MGNDINGGPSLGIVMLGRRCRNVRALSALVCEHLRVRVGVADELVTNTKIELETNPAYRAPLK